MSKRNKITHYASIRVYSNIIKNISFCLLLSLDFDKIIIVYIVLVEIARKSYLIVNLSYSFIFFIVKINKNFSLLFTVNHLNNLNSDKSARERKPEFP
jgi:hypothetical protein